MRRPSVERRVGQRPARTGQQPVELLVSELALCGEPSPATLAWVAANPLPPKDAPILAAAIDASCHLLATGDRTHFGKLFGKRVRGTVVALPVEAIEILIDEA